MFWVFQVSGQLKWALCRIQSHGTTHTLRDILQTMQQHLKSWYLFFQGPSASFAVQQWRCVLYVVTIFWSPVLVTHVPLIEMVPLIFSCECWFWELERAKCPWVMLLCCCRVSTTKSPCNYLPQPTCTLKWR